MSELYSEQNLWFLMLVIVLARILTHGFVFFLVISLILEGKNLQIHTGAKLHLN
jgi:hypothetical protein